MTSDTGAGGRLCSNIRVRWTKLLISKAIWTYEWSQDNSLSGEAAFLTFTGSRRVQCSGNFRTFDWRHLWRHRSVERLLPAQQRAGLVDEGRWRAYPQLRDCRGCRDRGTQVFAETGVVEIAKSLYLQPSFSAPVIFAGGLLFGLGMVLANGCASRALVLLGKGNLRSLVVIAIIAIFAQMTLKGLLAPLRLAAIQLSQVTPSAVSAPALLSSMGLDASVARFIITAILCAALLVFAFSDRAFHRSHGQMAVGVGVGGLVLAGWLATGWLGADEFNPVPVASLTFISPIADTVQYAMLSTGMTANFGIALVAGVLIGSLLTAIAAGKFELEGFTSPNHMLRSISGAALMGIGGAMAFGCSIGQGLTGLSTLAIPSFVAVAGILAGAAVGLRGPVVLPALAVR